MLKLLATSLLLVSFVNASTSGEKVKEYLEEKYSENTNIKTLQLEIEEEVALKELKDWKAYIVVLKATLKKKPDNLIQQKVIWFSNGEVITKELTSLKTEESLTDSVRPKFKDGYYKKENLIYGNNNAEHKVAIFSDPLCPFCRSFVPGAIEDMKKQPKKFAIYYYHFPLPSIHPASVPLVKAAVAAELKGYKNVVLNLYKVQVDAKEKDIKKVLTAFNKAIGSKLVPADLTTTEVNKQVNYDSETANNVMVNGTPTLYFDGAIDKTKKKYLKYK
ncbi:thioredoxin domain-containing protein [Sulfurimonas sp.]|jgi:predicted DsbA family dithiol-disulfide isomerase|uniref:DsbA family protein n=1 Tax=Sulfurimonas sp. TaxID=2022749 RepID=UPI0025CBE12F|nr:thioredoxin domain-containing protein [Sulfurimonas sp.]